MITLEVVKNFLMWCSIINGVIYFIWVLVILSASDWVFNLHSRWFKISRESFEIVMYGFIGLFKLSWLFFNLIPFLVLCIIS